MIAQLRSSLTILLLIPAAFLSYAAGADSSGTVRFSGSIVEDSCKIEPLSQPQKMQVQCRNNQMTVNTRSTSMVKNIVVTVPEITKMNVRWIDKAHRLGIVTMTYQ